MVFFFSCIHYIPNHRNFLHNKHTAQCSYFSPSIFTVIQHDKILPLLLNACAYLCVQNVKFSFHLFCYQLKFSQRYWNKNAAHSKLYFHFTRTIKNQYIDNGLPLVDCTAQQKSETSCMFSLSVALFSRRHTFAGPTKNNRIVVRIQYTRLFPFKKNEH